MEPIRMTRSEYEAKYGEKPKAQPVKMTRAEYEAKYGGGKPQGTFRYDVPTQQSSRAEQLQRAQEQAQSAQQEADKYKGVGFLKQFGKEFVKNIAPSQVGLGQTIAKTMTDPSVYSQNVEKLTQSNLELQKRIKEKEARGEDATALKRAYNSTVDLIEQNTKDIQGYQENLPTGKQVAGQIGGTALDLLAGGTYGRAAQGLKAGRLGTAAPSVVPVAESGLRGLARDILPAAGIGYGYDVTSKLTEGREQDVFKPGIGTAIGVGLPIAGRSISGAKAVIPSPAKVNKQTEKLVGEITQAKTPEQLRKAKEGLSRIDTSDVRTYQDLSKRADEKVGELSVYLDDILDDSGIVVKLDDLQSTTKIGDEEVTSNFVEVALDQLEDLYTKTNDPNAAAQIRQLRQRMATEGVPLKEVNQLARTYGSEYSQKAFSKAGEPLTSVTAQGVENVRTGVKGTARNLFDDDTYKALDDEISSIIKVRDEAQKMTQKVQQLQNKIKERGWGERIGRGLFQLVDMLSLGSFGGFTRAILPRGQGLKVMNALDLEKNLKKNLKELDELLQIQNEPAFQKKLQQMLNRDQSQALPTSQRNTTRAANTDMNTPIASNVTPSKKKANSESGFLTPKGAALTAAGTGALAFAGETFNAEKGETTTPPLPETPPETPKMDAEQPVEEGRVPYFQGDDLRKAFAYVETRGADDPYTTIGKTKDLGKYQVKPESLAEWSPIWLGRKYTKEEFLNDPEAQEKFMDRFMEVVNRLELTPQEAAMTWHKGWGILGSGKGTREERDREFRKYLDKLKKTGKADQYVETFNRGLKQ